MHYAIELSIQGQKLAQAAEALSKTLRGGISSGRVSISADEDFAQFISAALSDLDRAVAVFNEIKSTPSR